MQGKGERSLLQWIGVAEVDKQSGHLCRTFSDRDRKHTSSQWRDLDGLNGTLISLCIPASRSTNPKRMFCEPTLLLCLLPKHLTSLVIVQCFVR